MRNKIEGLGWVTALFRNLYFGSESASLQYNCLFVCNVPRDSHAIYTVYIILIK